MIQVYAKDSNGPHPNPQQRSLLAHHTNQHKPHASSTSAATIQSQHLYNKNDTRQTGNLPNSQFSSFTKDGGNG